MLRNDISREKPNDFLREKVGEFVFESSVFYYGTVQSTQDDVIWIRGLSGCHYGEILQFENNVYGLALDFSEHSIGAVLLTKESDVLAGSLVRGTGKVADICIGDSVLGRVIDPFGRPLDGMPLTGIETRAIEQPAPSIIERAPVKRPLETGILSIDSMIPIGRGQRELIIGDHQTGKSTIALAAIKNQRNKDVICIYCAIGQKSAATARIIHELTEAGCMEYTIVVATSASDRPAMQYLTPFAGCAIAEGVMHEQKDVLIVYDDLSKHAIAYRTMSLLLQRPAGREAYPGDIFYLHSRLLERSAQLSEYLGGGSMTALPIVETVGGDISAYIPTNIISITDGQIYLSSELFYAGMRPAINLGLSVSRIGSNAQCEAIKWIGSRLRLALSQYREIAVFSQFGTKVDSATAQQIHRGERMQELLKQSQNESYTISEEAVLLLALSHGVFYDLPLTEIREARKDLLKYLHVFHASSMLAIETTGKLSNEEMQTLKNAMDAYGGT
ncbi:MAG: F0F1 ATP synthase subunit alpha [Lachnospiraceae bacterium]